MPYALPTAMRITGNTVERMVSGICRSAIAPIAQIHEMITVSSGKNTPVNLLNEKNNTPATTMTTMGTRTIKS